MRVTAVPDADVPGSQHNTGVTGARHEIASTGTAGGTPPPSAEMLANLEIAHPAVLHEEAGGTKVIAGSLVADSDATPAAAVSEASDAHETPVNSEAAVMPEADVTPATEAGQHESAGYDETSGIVYEVQSHGFEILPQRPEAVDPETHLLEAVQPRDGLSGEDHPEPHATDTEEPAAGQHAGQPVGGQHSPGQPVGGAGTAWNQPMTPGPNPVEDAGESKGGAFGGIFGRGRSGADDDRGGLPPLTRVRDLPFDQKLRMWRLRAMIIIVVGVVFSVIANWETGITLAIIAGIADTIYRARTAEAHARPQEGTVDRATWRAQKRTIKQVSAMARAGYVAIHRRPIPGSTEVIDHLVIGPTGVYAIDSEKWDKDLPIRTRNGRQLWLGPESKKDRLEHARWEAGQAAEQLSEKLGREIVVQPTLAIYGPKIPWDIAVIREVDVFSGDRLRKYLHRRARRKDVPRLDSKQIAEIHQAATEVLPLAWQEAAAPVG